MRHVKPEVRILGVDDAPFTFSDETTELIGCLFRGSQQLEAVLRQDIQVDGLDATDIIYRMVTQSRQHDQIQVIMLDGITFGGFNTVDIKELHHRTDKPIIAVSRREPDRESLEKAIENVDEQQRRIEIIENAGTVVEKTLDQGLIYFQFEGITQETAGTVIQTSIRRGILPEPVRVAHIIASGIKTGESRGRA